jgi:hypothetical protein
MLESAEVAEAKYKKTEKAETPFGWDSFNSKSLYNAYAKRADKIEVGAPAGLAARLLACVSRCIRNTTFRPPLAQRLAAQPANSQPANPPTQPTIANRHPPKVDPEAYRRAKAERPELAGEQDPMEYGKAPEVGGMINDYR